MTALVCLHPVQTLAIGVKKRMVSQYVQTKPATATQDFMQ